MQLVAYPGLGYLPNAGHWAGYASGHPQDVWPWEGPKPGEGEELAWERKQREVLQEVGSWEEAQSEEVPWEVQTVEQEGLHMERERTGYGASTAEEDLQMSQLEEGGSRLQEGAQTLEAGCTAAAALQEWEHNG